MLIAALLGLAPGASAQVLITEIHPDVLIAESDGDRVEIFNSGSGAVDLTNWVLTDLDPTAQHTDPLGEGTFAPVSLGVPALQPGEFCVVTFASPEAPDTSTWTSQPHGLDITIELEPSFHRKGDCVALFEPGGDLVDSVCYGVSGEVPSYEPSDMRALTLPDANGYALGVLDNQTGWAGLDNVSLISTLMRYAVDFSAYGVETPTGSGSIQRINVGPHWMEGVPDGADFFVVTDIAGATLGAHTFDSTDGTLPLILHSGGIENFIDFLDQSAFGGPKLANAADSDDFVIPDALDRVRFRRVIDLMLAGEHTRAHWIADQVGYEVVEWTDTGLSATLHVLREKADEGDAGFRGQGTFIFDNTSENGLCVEVPHPLYDSLTLREGGDILVQVRPRLLIIAGTHRNSSTTDTPCDGTMSSGDPYRISDCAHSVITFFQMAHEQFVLNDPGAYVLQIHGYSQTTWATEPIDVIISEGRNFDPPDSNFSEVLADQIDAQGFLADGTDLTVAGVYSADIGVLGATNNTNGRFSNGVQWALCCDNYASTSNAHFIHMEQDLDVRQENQHIIDALNQTLGILGIPAELTVLRAD
jgi:Lamin Tail Domain